MNKWKVKVLPTGMDVTKFKYSGRPARGREGDDGIFEYVDDFGSDVGIADMACVNPTGEVVNNKYYHLGVITDGSTWWVYIEYGTDASPGHSWEGSTFRGKNFQFYECGDEQEARAAFQKQARSKNTKRLVNNNGIWASKKGKDGYLIRDLAVRTRGIPDARLIKSDAGIEKKADAAPITQSEEDKVPDNFQPQIVDLAKDLIGGIREYSRAQTEEAGGGVVPTMASIVNIETNIIPRVTTRIEELVRQHGAGLTPDLQIADPTLVDLSKLVAGVVPRPVRGRTKREKQLSFILSTENLRQLQDDLDVHKAALESADFKVERKSDRLDPEKALGIRLTWVDPKSNLGKWVVKAYGGMTNNRHSYIRGKLKVINVFAIERPGKDADFVDYVRGVAAKKRGYNRNDLADLQPKSRPDLGDLDGLEKAAQVIIGIHGTRSVNVAGILRGNFKLPAQLRTMGVHISGQAFGDGIYWACDFRKSWGYTGASGSYYGGGGMVSGRRHFMFLSDVAIGKPYLCKSTGNWQTPPNGLDSIFANCKVVGTLQNDEHIIFTPRAQRMRYLIEMDMV